METLTKYLAVAAGSALGGMLRYFLGTTFLARTAAPFPTVTFLINVTGSFMLGLLLTLAAGRLHLSEHLRLAAAVGFLGAYTTFSTFEYETLRLAGEERTTLALLNIFLSVVVGFLAVWGGMLAAQHFAPAPVEHVTASGLLGRVDDDSGEPLSGATVTPGSHDPSRERRELSNERREV